jgi:hypothetical protein
VPSPAIPVEPFQTNFVAVLFDVKLSKRSSIIDQGKCQTTKDLPASRQVRLVVRNWCTFYLGSRREPGQPGTVCRA